jgi:hypothetical protein
LNAVEEIWGDGRGFKADRSLSGLGDLDCYQWLLVVGQHSLRHALQIGEIKASAGYPLGD